MDIVIDKSYLHGAGRQQVENLCRNHKVLMPESLLYELLTTTPEKRVKCFGNFPDIENPVALVPNVGTLLGYEVANNIACKPVTKAAINVRFQFNSRLRETDYELPKEQAEELKKWKQDARADIEEFKKCSAIVYHWFPSLANYCPGRPDDVISEAEEAIANDVSIIRKIYNEIRHKSFPPANAIDKNWTLFRWVQCHFLAAIEYIRKYGPNNTSMQAKGIENDFLDIQYCITGIQVGAFASRDEKLKNIFQKICPDGHLLQ